MTLPKTVCLLSSLLILAACTPPEENVPFSSGEKATSSHICVDDGSVDVNELKRLENVGGNKLYCWRTACNSVRCIDLRGSINEDFDLKSYLKHAQDSGGYTVEGMKERLSRSEHLQADSYFIFQISPFFSDKEFQDFEDFPYSFLTDDESMYEMFGLRPSYEWLSRSGIFSHKKEISLPSDDMVDMDFLKEHDAFLWADYGVIASKDVNHIYQFKNGAVIKHYSYPFRFFSPANASEGVGLTFLELVEKFGMPSFLEGDDSTNIEYCFGISSIYRFVFAGSQGAMTCSSVLELNTSNSMFVGDKARMMAVEDVDESLLFTNVDSLIRKYGKPARLGNASPTRYIYKTTDGKEVELLISNYGLKFEDQIHRGLVLGVKTESDFFSYGGN